MEPIDLDFNGMDVSKIDVNLKHLYYFVVVAETGNITRAAQRLYMTQSTLSKNMALLEERVGVPLLHHTGRQITLSQTGEYLYKRWKRLITAYRDDMLQAEALTDATLRMLRVGCFPVLDTYRFLLPYTDALYRRRPKLAVEMYRMNYIRLLEHLNARKIDAIFTLLDDLPENREPYEWEVVSHHPLTAVVPAVHPLAAEARLQLEDLRGCVLLMNEPDGNLSRVELIKELLERHDVRPKAVQYVNNDLTAYLAAAQGRGVALGIRALYPEGDDAVRLIDLTDAEQAVAAVWCRDAEADVKAAIYDLFA